MEPWAAYWLPVADEINDCADQSSTGSDPGPTVQDRPDPDPTTAG
jgi:hypothetical protein